MIRTNPAVEPDGSEGASNMQRAEYDPPTPRQPLHLEGEPEDDMMGQMTDNGSISSTMCVKASEGDGIPFFHSHAPTPLRTSWTDSFQDFVIPQTPVPSNPGARPTNSCRPPATRLRRDAQLTNVMEDEHLDMEDDISVLTEFSGMEEEEDALSQVTAATEARTVVTTTTGSTTVPTRNLAPVAPSSVASSTQHSLLLPRIPESQRRSKRLSPVADAHHGVPLLDNNQYKRRRML